ncbi:MAG: chemotaxis protein CheB, partial [Nitrospiria bacterium]
DFFTKPKFDMQQGMQAKARVLASKVKVAAGANLSKRKVSPSTNEARARPLNGSAMLKTTDTIIAIGASTGGTEALRELLTTLPPNMSPIIITQHMPEKFTTSFAARLNQQCRLTVKEAENGDSLITGTVLIAPGNYQMGLSRSGARYQVFTNQEPRMNRHRPSVDYLFRSVSKTAGSNAIGVILTGMGADGAVGMREMKDAGAYNIAQDEATSVVFGMPKVAIEKGGVDQVCPLLDIADQLLNRLSK